MERLAPSGTRSVAVWVAAVGAIALVSASCGANDDDPGPSAAVEVTEGSADSSPDTTVDSSTETSEGSPVESEDAQPAAGGTLVLGEETISFDSARCFLEEQDAAAGGGKILFVVQAFGTNAAGDELVIDVSRYDEDSQFVGDDVTVDIGDPFSAEAVSWRANAELGTVQLDGSTVSTDGLTFVNFDDFSELPGSFRINC